MALRRLYTTAFCHFCESLSFSIFLFTDLVRLASRGAQFGDATLTITYRNASHYTFLDDQISQILTATDTELGRRPCGFLCGMGGRTHVHWAQGYPGHLISRVICYTPFSAIQRLIKNRADWNLSLGKHNRPKLQCSSWMELWVCVQQ